MRSLLISLCLAAAACTCGGKPPVKDVLKPLGEPCSIDTDCETGLCFALKGEGQKCGKKCASGCDAATEVCTQLGFQRYGCVPAQPGLCRTCETNADCPYAADSCIHIAGSMVCGQDCTYDGTCPDGYRCAPARDYTNNEVPAQCQPKSMTCDCTPNSVGQRMPCDRTNDAGTCLGVQVCEVNGYTSCSAQTPTAEICNGVDDNCDTRVDENLGETTCGVGECQRTYANCVNGRDQVCVPGIGGTEVCNDRDDNCNGTADDGFDKSTVQFCGSCTNSCSVVNGLPACADGGTCTIASCFPPFMDCSAGYLDGCETNTQASLNHCGACNNLCTAANATSFCDGGGCQFRCLPSFADVDLNPANGCEQGCVPVDVPDLAFADSNCDGIDGVADAGVFVDVLTGNDNNPGTRMAPKQHLMGTQGAISAAFNAIPKKVVFVSKGVYNESVTLQSGVSLYGGYDRGASWSRALANTTIIQSLTQVGITGVNLSQDVEVQLFTVTSASATGMDPSGDGQSSTGVLIRNSTGQVTLRRLTINAGGGSPGGTGASGGMGASGMKGGDAVAAAQGGQGPSQCGAPGGAGGNAPSGVGAGQPGRAGTQAGGGGQPAGGGGGGSSGSCSTTSSSSGGSAPAVPIGGGLGPVGVNGVPGSGFGSFSAAGLYTPAGGGDGTTGYAGGGGGGGGAGGGTAHGHNLICSDCSGHRGGGGGGGGGGGCGGGFGRGGRGGGGSFGVVSFQANVVIESSSITTGNGGRGGNGGDAGGGGLGGPPGGGSTGICHSQCTARCGGNGAAGSAGGQGGQGGGGSGGSGGPAMCVVYQGVLPQLNGTTCMPGTVGGGGTGGLGGGGRAANGSQGQAGVLVMAN